MKKVFYAIFLSICIVALILTTMLLTYDLAKKDPLAEMTEEIDLAKKEIATRQGFTANNTLWLETELVEGDGNTRDFYILTCIVEQDELYEYKFAVTIEIEDDGFVDIDAYRIYKK